MTVKSDIETALASYDIREITYAEYRKPRSHSIARYLVDVHVEHAELTDIPTIVTALEAITGYIAVIARLTSSWPRGDLYYSRFEVEILT